MKARCSNLRGPFGLLVKLVVACCCALIGVIAAYAPTAPSSLAPQVVKVEPPNWWAGHSLNPVRLLARGANLHGARVTTAHPETGAGQDPAFRQDAAPAK